MGITLEKKWFDVTITYKVTLEAKNAKDAMFKGHAHIKDAPFKDKNFSTDVKLTDLSKKIEPALDA